MKYSHIRLMAVVTLLIMTVTNCKCTDERCDGDRIEDYKSTEKAIVLLFASSADYVDTWGANVPYLTHEFTTDGEEEVFTVNYGSVAYPTVRLLNGWSDYGSYSRAMIEVSSLSESIECPEKNGQFDFHYTHIIDSLDVTYCTTPPTRLHLVLDDLRDFSSGSFLRHGETDPKKAVKAKVWEIDSLFDSQGQDLRASANWACFADNVYTFMNDDVVEYKQGSIICDGEPDEGKPMYFGYTVKAQNPQDHDNPGEIKLTIHVGGWVDGVEDVVYIIEESDFNRISGTVEKDGEVAEFVIRPR